MKKINLTQSGQALIELIVFLPLMISLYSVIGGFASSINGSINQQKVSRAYFYYRIQNNSNIPGPTLVDYSPWKQFSVYYIGWKDYFSGGETPVMPCYKVSVPFKNTPTDKCEDSYSETKTLWVRVGTVYGICGGTYINQDSRVFPALELRPANNYKTVVDRNSCVITQ